MFRRGWRTLSLPPDSTSPNADEGDFEARFAAWLRDEKGMDESRRVVRRGPSNILVSKFDSGFAARLHEVIAGLPEVFDVTAVQRVYADVASEKPGGTRVNCWHESGRRILEAAVAAGRVTPRERAEVLAGIDSVAALLDSVLWTVPLTDAAYVPSAGELDAFREAREKMDAENSLFTRFYGSFDGLPVVNHCPGAQFARRLFTQAWTICTSTPPPP